MYVRFPRRIPTPSRDCAASSRSTFYDNSTTRVLDERECDAVGALSGRHRVGAGEAIGVQKSVEINIYRM